MVKVRLPDAFRETFPTERRPPKYLEAYRDSTCLHCYPSLDMIQPGRPLILVEGELDALLLAQELGSIASVITLGSASMHSTDDVHDRADMATDWYAALDNDPAGDKAARKCPVRYRRVLPPGPHKDWTEAKAGEINLARWWRDRLSGIERPELFTWDELSTWRWGPAIGDESPGIVILEDDTRCRVTNLPTAATEMEVSQ